MVLPGWTPGPSHSPASTTLAASNAARSVALLAWRAATSSASRTARPRSRSLAALRNALASAATEKRRSRQTRRSPRDEIDVRPLLALARHRVGVRGRLVEARAEDEDRVGGVETLLDRGRRPEPGHPEVQRMVVGHHVRAAPGRDDRHLEEFGEAGQLRRRSRAQDTGAGQDHRPAGAGQELDDVADLVVGRAGDGRPGRVDANVVGHGLVEEILGQRQQDRARPAAEGLPDRLGHGHRDVLDRVRLDRPLGEPAEGRDLVDLLERLTTDEGPLDLADRDEHRGRILACRVDPDPQVGATDGARPEGDRRSSGQLAVGLGHERGAVLVACRDDPDAGALEGVEQAEERFARDGERVAHAGGPQRVGDEPTDGPRTGRFDRDVRLGRDIGSSARLPRPRWGRLLRSRRQRPERARGRWHPSWSRARRPRSRWARSRCVSVGAGLVLVDLGFGGGGRGGRPRVGRQPGVELAHGVGAPSGDVDPGRVDQR